MTVSSTQSRKTFAGNGVTTSFATTPIVFFDTADLTVYVTDDTTGVATTLVENTDYTVSGGSGAVGTVSLAGGSDPYGAPASGTTLVIVRELDIVQEVDFVNNESSDAEVMEDALDKLTMMLQHLESRIDRSFVLADSDVSGASTTLPTPEATTLLGWSDDAGELVNYAASALDLAIVSTFMETLLDDTTAAAARTTLGLTNVPLYGGIGKNAIIGGDFSTNPWQRGTSFSSVANAAYTADRWVYRKAGAMVHDVTKSADAPTVAQCGRLVTHSLMIDCTTVDASLASTDFCAIVQAIEGYNFAPFAQRTITLSFWHKHTKTGTYCVGVRNSGDDRCYVAEYTQAVADTWEQATVEIAASPSAGTWDYTNGIGLQLFFMLAAGSSFQTTAGAWQTGSSLIATANQVNACDSTSNNFKIALVQLEPGSLATEFEYRTVQQELALCQRYYWRQKSTGATSALYGYGVAATTVTAQFGMTCPVDMRTIPTLTSGAAASDFNVSDGNASTAVTVAPSLMGNTNTVRQVNVTVDVAAGLTQFRPVRVEAATENSYIALSAEL